MGFKLRVKLTATAVFQVVGFVGIPVKSAISYFRWIDGSTVDGRNPKQPPGMYKIL